MALPANPASPSSPFQSPSDWFSEHAQRNHRNTPHGHKRRADEQDEGEYTPSNDFKRLRISPRTLERSNRAHINRNDTPLPTRSIPSTYHPPAVSPDHDLDLVDQPTEPYHDARSHHQEHPRYTSHHLAPSPPTIDTPPPQLPPHTTSDLMPLDDNPHRIFISDLDAAIAEIEAEERAAAEKQQEAAFFLPDEVDKEISGVPQHVLQQQHASNRAGPDAAGPNSSQALVLYRDPLSISVPEEEDAVRKAVREARERMRRDSASSEGAQRREALIDAPHRMEDSDFGYPLGRQHASWDVADIPQLNRPGYEPDVDAMDMDIE